MAPFCPYAIHRKIDSLPMKISTQFFITAFAFLFGLAETAAQESVNILTGTVTTANGDFLPYANVALKDSESGSLIGGTVSDGQGHFRLVAAHVGEAYLEISSLGYLSFRSEAFDLGGTTRRDFGALLLEEEVSALSEVTVNGMRSQIDFQADKTVVNVEGSALSEGNTALDVIGRSPGVFVDADGKINLNGRSGVIVMIDDRQTYMSAEDLANFLRAMPADNLKSIEVINNPSSRYDAEGAAGIINLRLKKNDLNGINGNVNIGHRYNGIHAPNAGGSLNVKKGKWTTNSSLNYNEWAQFNDLEILRRFQQEEGIAEFDQTARLKLVRKNLFFNGGADYQLNDSHRLGANLQLSRQNGTEDGLSNTQITNPAVSLPTSLRAINDSQSDNSRVFVNVHYVGELDTLGTKLTSDIDYTYMDAGSLGLLSNRYWTTADEIGRRDRILTGNEMYYTILTSKVDYTKPLKKGRSLELGVKGSWVRSDNDLQLFKSEEEGEFVPDANSNRFIYHENVLAAYTNYHTNIGSKVAAQAGLRMEYSDILGNSVTMDEQNKQRYADLFPSVSVQHKISDN